MEFDRQIQLGHILEALAENHGWNRARWLRILDAIWHRVVGDTVYQHTRILGLTGDGVLTVAVSSSIWSQELTYYKPLIMAAIRNEIPEMFVKDVKTRVRAQLDPVDDRETRSHSEPYHHLGPVTVTDYDLSVLLAKVQEQYQIATQVWLSQGFFSCERCHAPTPARYRLCVVCDLERKRTT